MSCTVAHITSSTAKTNIFINNKTLEIGGALLLDGRNDLSLLSIKLSLISVFLQNFCTNIFFSICFKYYLNIVFSKLLTYYFQNIHPFQKIIFCINYFTCVTNTKINTFCKEICKDTELKLSITTNLKSPPNLQCFVVYYCVCPNCRVSYIGQTTRHWVIKLKEYPQ